MRASTQAAAALLSLASLLGTGAALAQTDSAPAESLYVIEQLTVSVSSTADGGDRVGQIKSGDRVEVLERSGDQARVKIPSGEEGWVRASYLSASRPLREQLKASTEELEKLRQDKSKLEADLAVAKKAAASAAASATPGAASSVVSTGATTTAGRGPTAAATTTPAPGGASASTAATGAIDTGSSSESAADPLPSNPPMFADTGIFPTRPSWIFALIVAVAALGAGFALGWRMLDRRIRAKYGGLRIY